MNKKILLIFAVIFLLVLIVGVYSLINIDEHKEIIQVPENPYIEGKIYSIEENKILIAEGAKEDYMGEIEGLIGNAIWLTIDEETEILDCQGKAISLENLMLEENVKAWTKGVILESYPAQSSALRIELIEQPNDLIEKPKEEEKKEEEAEEKKEVQECFIGGCSGEICSSDPEAISTCEFLLGMECLSEEMSCQSIEGECTWVLSEASAQCFLEIEREHGLTATDTRIGYLFEKARKFKEK